MSESKKLILFDEIKTPPVETEARTAIGELLREFQNGNIPEPPVVKPIGQIGRQCYEIRKPTDEHNWRAYIAIRDRIVFLYLEDKKSKEIPKLTIELCKRRLREYERAESEYKCNKQKVKL